MRVLPNLRAMLAIVLMAIGVATVSVIATPTSAHAACINSPFQGNWKNIDANTRSMTRVSVSFTCNDTVLCDIHGHCTYPGTSHAVKAWGRCHPTDCYWGSRPATSLSGDWLKAVYNFGFKTSTVRLKTYEYYGKTYLRVYVNNDFTPSDGRADYTTDEWMLKY